MVDFKYPIYNEKCQLLLRIKMLDEAALAKQVYQQAETNSWPGLGSEVRQICEEIQIQDINKYNVGKKEIQQAVYEAHYKAMLNLFEKSKKLQDIKNDNFRGMQSYFNDKNLANSRMKFKIRTKMVEKIPGNFKNRYKFSESGLNCSSCKIELTQAHCALCPARAELRQGLDMVQTVKSPKGSSGKICPREVPRVNFSDNP